MSRGPRDLRDLICVSRLTFRASDDEVVSEDDQSKPDLDSFSLDSSGSCDSRQGSASRSTQKVYSPDSGVVTNGSSPLDYVPGGGGCGENKDELKLDLSSLSAGKKIKRKKKKKKGLEIDPPCKPFPKPNPLPPVGHPAVIQDSPKVFLPQPPSFPSSREKQITKDDLKNSKINTNKAKLIVETLDNDIDEHSTPVRSASARLQLSVVQNNTSNAETGDFDEMLCFMDATVVSNWLSRANKAVSDIAAYIHAEDNFVQFAHFWLTDFTDSQKREIFELELEILREELGFAFSVGREQGRIKQRDISNLIGAIFREYPVKVLSSKGSFLFLDYLDILASNRAQNYKKLLSDVKCSTHNKQYAQWILATRSFALVSMWCAIVNFYRNLLGRSGKTQGIPIPETHSVHRNIYEKRLYQALRLGFTDVIHYLHVSGTVNLSLVDSHERTLIFTAVMLNKPKVLQYLIGRVIVTDMFYYSVY